MTPDTFLRLRDTPDTYAGSANKFVQVNATADGLKFTTGGGGGFSGLYTDLDFTGGNLTSIPTRTFASLQSIPTTLAGYGITDAVPNTRTVNGHALSSNVTVTASDVGAPSGSGTSTGTNTGDQTSIVGITGTLAQFNSALTGADFATGGGTATGTNTGDQDLSGLVPNTRTVNGHPLSANVTVTAADVGAPSGSGTSTGTNTGDQTSIVGITGTKAQFDTAVTDGNILYAGDVTQYTDELAQDAVGGMVDGSLTYVDATPLLQRAALTGDVTAAAGSNVTALAAGDASKLNSGTLLAARMPALTGDVTTSAGAVATAFQGMNLAPTTDFTVQSNRGMVFPSFLDLTNANMTIENGGVVALGW